MVLLDEKDFFLGILTLDDIAASVLVDSGFDGVVFVFELTGCSTRFGATVLAVEEVVVVVEFGSWFVIAIFCSTTCSTPTREDDEPFIDMCSLSVAMMIVWYRSTTRAGKIMTWCGRRRVF